MRTITILILILSLVKIEASSQSFGSPKQLIKEGRFAYLVGYNYNKNHFGELGIVRGWRSNYNGSQSEMPAQQTLYPYASLSSEFLIDNNLIICPKLGYHIVFSFLHTGISIFSYTDFKQNKFGLRPELGLSLGGVVGVCYGYNLSTHNDTFGISNHNLSVKMIFGSGLLK